MSTVSVRIDKELFDAAAAEGKANYRSAAQQLNFWIKRGMNIIDDDPFYSNENIARLKDSIAEMESGKVVNKSVNELKTCVHNNLG